MIDKQAHVKKYAKWHFHPYHYCLTALIERYVCWLEEELAVGDVMAEAREKKQNIKLEEAYKHIFKNGTGFAAMSHKFVSATRMQRRFTSGEIKTKTKKANVAGLQLVDIIANPARRHLLCTLRGETMTSTFGRAIVVERKGTYLVNRTSYVPSGLSDIRHTRFITAGWTTP